MSCGGDCCDCCERCGFVCDEHLVFEGPSPPPFYGPETPLVFMTPELTKKIYGRAVEQLGVYLYRPSPLF